MGGRKKKKRFPRPNVLQSIFSLAANLQMSVAGVVESRYFRFREQKADIMELAERYSRLKGELNVVDFDDLLLGWLALMTRTEKAGRMIAERFLHVLVDEYQDVNTLQARIVDQVATKGHASLTVVGDDAQSIYSFRGASVDLMLDFDTRYPQARILRLQTNYRSTPEILGLANRSITFNHNRLEKTLKASRQGGVTPVCVALGSTLEQACFVAQRILELHHDEGFELNKIGVLYRAHAHSMELQVELGRRQIPFAVRSGLRFFEQAHIKDGLAFLRILQNPADELALGRVFHVHSGVGRATEKKVLAALKRNVAPPAPMPTMAAQIRRLLENEALGARVDGSLRELAAGLERLQQEIDRGGVKAGLSWFGDQLYADYAARHFNNAEIRLEDLAQLAEYGRRFDRVEPFLSEIALAGGMAAQGLKPGQVPSGDHLTLSTVHQAKGLEWQVVFVIWLCDGMFPSVLALKDLGGEEEERRLFHVAATRAKDQLYLCRPLCSDRTAGFRKILRPSRFLTELQPAPPFETWEIELDIEDAD
jgi:DNA helicase-2/ATP-dependent DNA helicase PcrA